MFLANWDGKGCKVVMANLPIALVIPWYGKQARGGAEQECNFMAHCLSNAGHIVEVFTTCVPTAADDRGVNVLPPGAAMEDGILVRRFPVKRQNRERYEPANLRIFRNESFSKMDEQAYIEEDINSPEMYDYIKLHKEDYRCFIPLPYLYGVVYHVSRICPEKTVMIPCLHDESYAYMSIFKELMPRLKGMVFLSWPECRLANMLYPLNPMRTEVLGAVVPSGWEEQCNADAFRVKFNINDPYIVFAGRKDAGKKADELRDFFIRYKSERPDSALKLVFIGGGNLDIPAEWQRDIFDLGFLSEQDKHDALAGALLLCNPSQFESFSIVIMESWQAGRPVMVSALCPVTADFCRRSGGGKSYSDYQQFSQQIDWFLTHKSETDAMGQRGKAYVQNNFIPDKMAKKMTCFLAELNL